VGARFCACSTISAAWDVGINAVGGARLSSNRVRIVPTALTRSPHRSSRSTRTLRDRALLVGGRVLPTWPAGRPR
jgi:hypothetical protein